MPQSDHVSSPTESIQSLPAAASPIRMPKPRHPGDRSSSSGGGGGSGFPSRPLPLPLSMSEANLGLPLRRATPTAATLYASTLTPPGSRSMSPVGRIGSPAARTMSLTSSSSGPTAMSSGTTSSWATATATATAMGTGTSTTTPTGAVFTRSLLDSPAAEYPGDPLNLILKAFVPHVAIYSSADTDALARDKGFAGGLWELLRPFGEQVQGKVTVRDSNGAARSWDDFAVRFVRFGDNIETPEPVRGVIKSPTTSQQIPLFSSMRRNNTAPAEAAGSVDDEGTSVAAADPTSNETSARIPLVEAVVNQHLRYAERAFLGFGQGQQQQQRPSSSSQPPAAANQNDLDVEHTSPYYSLYLRRLLSGLPVASHETFAHPVACVIAISSRNAEPISTFRELYRDISQGERRLPGWVDGDFLRYYVLVHDEENGDIVQSMALFEKMKRSLGLHCHLLRLRSAPAIETDDDSIPLPRSDWMTAADEYADLERSEQDEENGDYVDPTRYIFESDATAIRTFVREMVTQSVVPTMERSVAMWNDQVASKRKGLSGRFMSLSKRWAGFGGGGSSSGGGGASSGGGNSSSRNSAGGSSNYDGMRGCYAADAPEAVLRKLADYAFMLRDWKLAMSTYDLLRTDFSNDKAWRHHAAANEMAALALLIMPTALSSRTKPETIHTMLEQAFYSYHTRCASAYGALRCIALALELQRLRGGPAVDEAVRWGMRLLEARLAGPVGDALLRERMAVCCATRRGGSSSSSHMVSHAGAWRRKSAFWSVLAAETWVAQACYIQAQRCLNEARQMYSMLPSDEGISGFARARDFMAGLQHQLKRGLTVEQREQREQNQNPPSSTRPSTAAETSSDSPDDPDNPNDPSSPEVELLVDDHADKLARRRSRRDSLLGGSGVGGGPAALESAPLRQLSKDGNDRGDGDDGGKEARPDSGFGQV